METPATAADPRPNSGKYIVQAVNLTNPPSGTAHIPESQAVASIAQRKLYASPYASLRRVTCHFHEGVLTLRGRVPTYHMKQVTQTIVALIEGVEQVVNRVEVCEFNLALRDNEVA